ncbi:MAG: AraC family transcriptional regulator [Eubacteriales bacterium]|jgi:AraC-like DNA-binding protein/mannose-6-phosphate isomerase-like protein (cupin superfamily)
MTIPELDQYLSRAFPFVENLDYRDLASSSQTNTTDGSNIPFEFLQTAYMKNIFVADKFVRNEHPEQEGLLIHIHSRFSPVENHRHEFFEMMYVRSGEVVHHIGDRKVNLAAGDFLLIAPGVFHCIDVCGENDIALNFIFSLDYLTPSFLHLISRNQLFYDFFKQKVMEGPVEKPFINIKAGRFPDVLETADKMLCEFFDPDICSASMLKCMFPNLINLLFRAWKESGGSIKPRKNMDDNDINQIIKYIETNFASATLKEAASRFGYHPDYLSRLIKKELGITFGNLKHRICIEQAKFLLVCTDLTVSQVAEQIGFSNMTFFYELFSRYCGTTPADYRNNIGQERLQL